MEFAKLLQHINAIHQTTFELGQRYPDGEQGAFAIIDQQENQCVLKWHAKPSDMYKLEEARTITDRLYSLAYPVPRYLFIGSALNGVYSIQQALPGSPMRHLTAALLSRLLELNQLQQDQAPASHQNWHREAVNTVLRGGDGYCLHTSLQHYSQSTANLLQELQRLVSTHQNEPHRTNDIVHGDFQHANILVHNGQVSGIIDWQAPGAGDCVFDIATLLFYAYDDPAMRDQLWRYALARTSLKLLSVYLAHLILRQVDWSLRFHDRPTGTRYIARGEALLQEIASHLRATV